MSKKHPYDINIAEYCAGETYVRVRLPKDVDWKPIFLEELRKTANTWAALTKVGVKRGTYYRARKLDPAFEQDCKDALEDSIDKLKLEARRRAFEGVEEPILYKGQIVGFWVDQDGNQVRPGAGGAKFIPIMQRRFSDALLMFLLKAHKPGEFRENMRIEHTGAEGGDINVKHNGMTAEQFSALSQEEKMRVLRERNANWKVDGGTAGTGNN